MDPYRPDPDIERILKLVLPSLNDGLKQALEYMLRTFSYYITFEDFSRMLLIKLEEKMRLPEDIKRQLIKELQAIYETSAKEIITDFAFDQKDINAVQYAEKLHDFYLGNFFQADKELRKRVVNWLSRYYLEEGNPMGKDQKGIKEFLEKFGNYIRPQTEWKARQVIDTSVNFLRNAGRITAMQKARIEYYRWDATNDRLTCPVCRSMDGRVFKTQEAVRVLDYLATTQDPQLIKDARPFINTPQKGRSDSIPTKMPPVHAHCRCRVVAHIEEIEDQMPVVVEPAGKDSPQQRDLLQEYQSLTKQEIINKIKAHLGSSWERGEERHNINLLFHFEKHADILGVRTVKEYKDLTYDIIKNPQIVFVQKNQDNSIDYIFVKDGVIAVSNDDKLLVKSVHKLKISIEEWLKDAEKKGRTTIRIF